MGDDGPGQRKRRDQGIRDLREIEKQLEGWEAV